MSVMEYIAAIHDKIGNGSAGHIYVFKKVNSQVAARVRTFLDNRAYQTISRKLFSIYRFTISNVKASTIKSAK